MEYHINRISKPSDLRELLGLFGEVFEDIPTYRNKQPNDDYLAELLHRDTFIALTARQENDSGIIGGLATYVLDKFEQERREVYIYDLAVREDHRRRGIATKLIRHLQGIAEEIGAYVIFVQADQGDIPAISLYESLGIREDVHHFDIPPLSSTKKTR